MRVLCYNADVEELNMSPDLSEYRYRSESLHEGNGQNISSTELLELEQVVRRVLVNYLDYYKQSLYPS